MAKVTQNWAKVTCMGHICEATGPLILSAILHRGADVGLCHYLSTLKGNKMGHKKCIIDVLHTKEDTAAISHDAL